MVKTVITEVGKTVTPAKSATSAKWMSPEVEELCATLLKVKASRKKADEKAKALKAECDSISNQIEERLSPFLTDPTEATSVAGNEFVAEFSACRRKAGDVDKKTLIDLIGLPLFVELASFSIEDLKTYLTGEQFEKLVKYEHSGSRTLSVKKR